MMGDAAASSGYSEDSDYEVGKHFDLVDYRPGQDPSGLHALQ